MKKKQTRVRCSEKKFLEAVYSSATYEEIAEKTGQQITSTIARYKRVKKDFSEKGLIIPSIKKKNSIEKGHNKDMSAIISKLRQHHNKQAS